MTDIILRPLGPEDYLPIITVIDEWWGGRHMADHLPRLFFDYFRDTSFLAESGGERVGFLAGFVSASSPDIAYVHFIGVSPEFRGSGLGRMLYEAFFAAARARGCVEVRAVTHPVNTPSIAFHRAVGFVVVPGDAEANGISYHRDDEGPGGDRVHFAYLLVP